MWKRFKRDLKHSLTLEVDVLRRGDTSLRDELQVVEILSEHLMTRTEKVGKVRILAPVKRFKYKCLAYFFSVQHKWDRSGEYRKDMMHNEYVT